METLFWPVYKQGLSTINITTVTCLCHLSLSQFSFATEYTTTRYQHCSRNQRKKGEEHLLFLPRTKVATSKSAGEGMEQTVSLRICRMREVLHVVDEALLEAFTSEAFAAGQDAAIPPVHTIPEHRVQVQNVYFCVIHGWTAIVPLPVVECGLPTASSSPPVPMGDAESSATTPMDVDLAAPLPPPPTAVAVGRHSPTPLTLVVVGTITIRRGQPPRVVDAPRGRVIFNGHRLNGVAPFFSSNGRAEWPSIRLVAVTTTTAGWGAGGGGAARARQCPYTSADARPATAARTPAMDTLALSRSLPGAGPARPAHGARQGAGSATGTRKPATAGSVVTDQPRPGRGVLWPASARLPWLLGHGPAGMRA
jgi:hypothetical protein